MPHNGQPTIDELAVALAKRANGYELRDDNQVDAWWPVPLPKAQRATLDKVTWPEPTGVLA